MSEDYHPITVKRILVALDHSTHSLSALEAAVELAHQYNAELKGVFVEDLTLINLAKMDFCQEVGQHTAIIREITTDGVSRGIYVQSRWVIQSFRKLINQSGIRASFMVLRGDVHKTIEKESETYDLIIIGKTGTNPILGHRLGSTAQALIKNHKIPLLLIEENTRLGYPLIVAYYHTPTGKLSLETAKSLLSPEETLIILLCEDDQDEYQLQSDALFQWASANRVDISIEGYMTTRIKRMITKIKGLTTGLLILPDADDQTYQMLHRVCLEEINLPILLIR